MVVFAHRGAGLEPGGLGRGSGAGGGDLDQCSHDFIVAGEGKELSDHSQMTMVRSILKL